MPIRELMSSFKFFQAIPPQIIDAGLNGVDVDLQGFEACTFAINLGALSSITSASYWVFRMQHASASTAGGAGTYSDCETSHVLMSVSTAITSGIVFSVFSDTGFESATHAVAYRGPRQFVRLVIEEKGNLSTAAMGVVAMLGHPAAWPATPIG